jgi:hypothetical protein
MVFLPGWCVGRFDVGAFASGDRQRQRSDAVDAAGDLDRRARPAPTPAGVPVMITSPGASTKSFDSSAMISGSFQISWLRVAGLFACAVDVEPDRAGLRDGRSWWPGTSAETGADILEGLGGLPGAAHLLGDLSCRSRRVKSMPDGVSIDLGQRVLEHEISAPPPDSAIDQFRLVVDAGSRAAGRGRCRRYR